jgi:hypothetical protein
MEVVVTGHKFESILPKDHPCHVCFKLELRCIQHADILKRTYLCQVSDTGSPEPLVINDDITNAADINLFTDATLTSFGGIYVNLEFACGAKARNFLI